MRIAAGPCFALALACIAAAPVAAQAPAIVFRADPPPALTAFQWALSAEGALLLAPDGDALRPARRAGPGLIETRPPQLRIVFHGEDAERAAPLSGVVSPLEIGPDAWIMEVRAGDGWAPAEWWFFDQMRFHRRSAPGAYDTPDLADLRFRAR